MLGATAWRQNNTESIALAMVAKPSLMGQHDRRDRPWQACVCK